MVGLKASEGSPRRRPGDDPVYSAVVAQRVQELTSAIAEGGPREAALRALLYVRQPEGSVDELGFNLLRRMRDEAGGLTFAEFKELVREQFFMLLLDERRAVNAIPAMLAKDPKSASRMAGILGALAPASVLSGATGAQTSRQSLSSVAAVYFPNVTSGFLFSYVRVYADCTSVLVDARCG